MTQVSNLIWDVADELNLCLDGLDGVTIAYDYTEALAKLDRGFQTERVLTATSDAVAEGVAMAPLVIRAGKIMSHVVLNAAILPTINQPEFGVNGRYLISHELAHVHEHHCRDIVLPGTLLQPLHDRKGLPAVLLQIAEACWCEYAACFLSASIEPDHVRIFEQTIRDSLPLFRDQIITARQQWLENKDYGAALGAVATAAGSMLKYVAYLLGHARGLDTSPEEIAPDTWAVLRSQLWLFPWVGALSEALASMLDTFDAWTGMEAFAALEDVARGLLADCGITLRITESGSLFVVVDPTGGPWSARWREE